MRDRATPGRNSPGSSPEARQRHPLARHLRDAAGLGDGTGRSADQGLRQRHGGLAPHRLHVIAINMVLQDRKVRRWRDHLHGERAYMLSSRITKSLLAWRVFVGTSRP
jgi:hypothetical protein